MSLISEEIQGLDRNHDRLYFSTISCAMVSQMASPDSVEHGKRRDDRRERTRERMLTAAITCCAVKV